MRVPALELQNRTFTLQQKMRQEGIEGALLVQRADTLYFSGTAQNVHVYIPREGRPVVLAYRDFARAQAESSWGVIPLTGFSKIPDLIHGAGLPLPTVLGLEFDVLPVNHFERYRKLFSEASFRDVSALIRSQRARKSEWELQRLEESARIFPEVLSYAQQILRPGMSEVELESLLEGKAREVGHEGFVRVRDFDFEFHWCGIMAGARAAVQGSFNGPVVGQGVSIEYPQGASRAQIQEGEPVVIDLVTVAYGYQMDQTRILTLKHIPEPLQDAHAVALAVEERLRRAMVPGRVAGEIYEEILTWVKENTPYADNFMGYGQGRVGFLGHGVGLELDEQPTISKGSKEVLQPGMVVAIEPKLVFPGLGAVGVEDTVVVEGQEGARFLCPVPREIVII